MPRHRNVASLSLATVALLGGSTTMVMVEGWSLGSMEVTDGSTIRPGYNKIELAAPPLVRFARFARFIATCDTDTMLTRNSIVGIFFVEDGLCDEHKIPHRCLIGADISLHWCVMASILKTCMSSQTRAEATRALVKTSFGRSHTSTPWKSASPKILNRLATP